MAVAVEGEIKDRLGVGLDFLDDRLVDLVRKAPAHPPHPVANVGGGIVGIAIELEGDGDLARFLPADRGDEIDALDTRQGILEHLSDLALYNGRAGAGIICLHGDHGRVDGGIFAHREPLVTDEAEQHQHEAHHRGEDRPLDGEFGKSHGSKPRWHRRWIPACRRGS